MKRCPQCEFIYEDDQKLCDMDGVLLVFDSRTLPNLHSLATLPEKPQRRNRAVPAFATVILALVLGMVYYVSTQRPGTAPEIAPVPVAATEPAPPAELDEPAAVIEEANSTEETPTEESKEESKPSADKSSVARNKKSAKNSQNSQTKTSARDNKDDSKVGSILKKTGRILKKPFKF